MDLHAEKSSRDVLTFLKPTDQQTTLDRSIDSRTTMASKTFISRKKTETAAADGGAGGDISPTGFTLPNSNEAAPPECQAVSDALCEYTYEQ